MTASIPSSTIGFLELPAELRNQIYDNVIEHNASTNSAHVRTNPLIAASRQIRNEFSPMHWNHYRMRHDETSSSPALPPWFFRMPKTIASNIGLFEYRCISHDLEDRGSIQITFSYETDKGEYSLYTVATSRNVRGRVYNAVTKYECWKAIRQVERWMEKKLDGHTWTKTAKPYITLNQGPSARRTTTLINDRSEDPWYLRIIGCILGEIHLYVLRNRSWVVDLLLWVSLYTMTLGPWCYLRLVLTYTQTFPVVFVGIPAYLRLDIQRMDWFRRRRVLRATMAFWLGISVAYWLALAFNPLITDESLSVWHFALIPVSLVLALA